MFSEGPYLYCIHFKVRQMVPERGKRSVSFLYRSLIKATWFCICIESKRLCVAEHCDEFYGDTNHQFCWKRPKYKAASTASCKPQLLVTLLSLMAEAVFPSCLNAVRYLFFPHHQAQIPFLFIKLYIDPFFSEVWSKGSAVLVSPGPNAVLQPLSYSRPAKPESALWTRSLGVLFRLHNRRNDMADQLPHGWHASACCWFHSQPLPLNPWHWLWISSTLLPLNWFSL